MLYGRYLGNSRVEHRKTDVMEIMPLVMLMIRPRTKIDLPFTRLGHKRVRCQDECVEKLNQVAAFALLWVVVCPPSLSSLSFRAPSGHFGRKTPKPQSQTPKAP